MSGKTTKRLYSGTALLSAAAACGLAARWGADHRSIMLVIVEGLLAPLPFVIRGAQRRFDPFEPINLMALGLIMWFVGRPIYELVKHPNPYPGFNASLGFNTAMMIGIAGTAALYAGYFSRYGRRLARRVPVLPDDWDTARSLIFVRRLLIIGLLLTLGYAAQAGVHFVINLYTGRSASQRSAQHVTSAYFEQGAYLTIPASLILLVAWTKRRDLLSAMAALCTIALALLVTVPRGDRTYIIELVVPLAVLFYLRRDRRPTLRLIIVAALVFGIAANIEVSLRNKESRPGRSVPTTILRAIERPWEPLGKQFVTGADPSEFTVLEIEAHAYQIGFLKPQHFGTIRNILVGWIPHQVLQKPLTPLQYVSWTLFPATRNAGSYGPPMFGSMYADFGWPAVLVLSALVGVGLSGLWEYFRDRLHIRGMQLVFAGILPLVPILLRDDIDDVFYRSVFIAVPLIVCVRVCSRPPKRLRSLLPAIGGRAVGRPAAVTADARVFRSTSV